MVSSVHVLENVYSLKRINVLLLYQERFVLTRDTLLLAEIK